MHKNETNVVVRRRKLSFSEPHQEGQTDIFPGAERGGGMRAYHWDPVHFSSTAADAAHQGYFAFAAYRGHLMRFTSPTHERIQPGAAIIGPPRTREALGYSSEGTQR